MDFEAFLSDVLTPLLDHPRGPQSGREGRGAEDRGADLRRSQGPRPDHRQARTHDLLPAHAGEGRRREGRAVPWTWSCTTGTKGPTGPPPGADRPGARSGVPLTCCSWATWPRSRGSRANSSSTSSWTIRPGSPGWSTWCWRPPHLDLERRGRTAPPARPVPLRGFRWHQDRPCVALEEVPDRTAAEPYKGWALWTRIRWRR